MHYQLTKKCSVLLYTNKKKHFFPQKYINTKEITKEKREKTEYKPTDVATPQNLVTGNTHRQIHVHKFDVFSLYPVVDIIKNFFLIKKQQFDYKKQQHTLKTQKKIFLFTSSQVFCPKKIIKIVYFSILHIFLIRFLSIIDIHQMKKRYFIFYR